MKKKNQRLYCLYASEDEEKLVLIQSGTSADKTLSGYFLDGA